MLTPDGLTWLRSMGRMSGAEALADLETRRAGSRAGMPARRPEQRAVAVRDCSVCGEPAGFDPGEDGSVCTDCRFDGPPAGVVAARSLTSCARCGATSRTRGGLCDWCGSVLAEAERAGAA